jgi:hypothetical protein
MCDDATRFGTQAGEIQIPPPPGNCGAERNHHKVIGMETINAPTAMSIYLPMALYAIVSIVGWRLMKRQRKSKAERATYWQACYIKLDSLAKSHRRRAAEFEIQAEKFRLRWVKEQQASRRKRFDEMFFKK